MNKLLTYRYPELIKDNGKFVEDQLKGSTKTSLLDSLIPLLDGAHSIEEIYGKLLIEGYPAEEIVQNMEELEMNHCLQESQTPLPHSLTKEESIFYASQMRRFQTWNQEYLSVDPAGKAPEGKDVQIKLKEASVLIVGLHQMGKELVHSLAQAGIGTLVGISESPVMTQDEIHAINPHIQYHEIHSEDELADDLCNRSVNLMVYSPDVFDEEYCQTLNSLALTTNTQFIVARQNQTTLEFGPLVIPHETACYTCYDRRRKAAVPYRDTKGNPQAEVLFNFSIGIGLLTLEIIKILTYCAEPISKGRLWRLNLLRGLSDVHPVLKLPRCPACGVHRHSPPSKLWEE